MNKKLMIVLAIFVMAALMLSACGAKATEAPAEPAVEEPAAEEPAAEEPAAEEPAAGPDLTEDVEVSMVPAKPGAPFDINGKVICYIIPSLANPFLNGVATSVTEKFKADGVEVKVYGADEGGLNQQFDQIENCISMKVDMMYVMAAGEFDQLLPSVEEVKKAGIPVMGVPPLRLAPFDAIMHTSQREDGEKVARMACDFIECCLPGCC